MDVETYRERSRSNEPDRRRVADLVRLLPPRGASCLDVGADDGYVSALLAERFELVVACDLIGPETPPDGFFWTRADAARLPFADRSFDLVACTEVLEHVDPAALATACRELQRVARQAVLIGVPYRQDTRLGRSTCGTCGRTNPPWGHVNTFDEDRLRELFSGSEPGEISYVGRTRERTNWLSTALSDLAGNPYGVFGPGSCCVHCGARLERRRERSAVQRVLTRLAACARRAQRPFVSARPAWIHMLWRVGPRQPRP